MSNLSICSVTIGGSAPVAGVPGVGGATYYFRGSSCYSTIADQTGVTVIKRADWGNDEPIIPVAALELPGKVIRVVAPYTATSDGTGKIKYAELVIDRGKLSAIEAKNSLKGKEYKITTITGTTKTLGFFQNNGRVRRRAVTVL
jgi:hypothetical protein